MGEDGEGAIPLFYIGYATSVQEGSQGDRSLYLAIQRSCVTLHAAGGMCTSSTCRPPRLMICQVAALSAGNTVCLKPSEQTPATSSLLGELINKHMDPEVIRVVQGSVEVATQAS